MLPNRVSNPGPLTCKSGALTIVLRGPALDFFYCFKKYLDFWDVLEGRIRLLIEQKS